jgi:dTDP-4-dehydrorhamnose 3,5-epimerase
MDATRESADGVKDAAHISSEWIIERTLITGVALREIRSVVTANSVTTEICRSDWGIVDGTIEQTIHVDMRGLAISAWHLHRERWDYLFVVSGHLRVVLYDPRDDSPTRGQIDVFHLSPRRPQLLSVPPRIWHGVQNLSTDSSSFINLFNKPYDYADPDEWRLPVDSDQVPYTFR